MRYLLTVAPAIFDGTQRVLAGYHQRAEIDVTVAALRLVDDARAQDSLVVEAALQEKGLSEDAKTTLHLGFLSIHDERNQRVTAMRTKLSEIKNSRTKQ